MSPSPEVLSLAKCSQTALAHLNDVMDGLVATSSSGRAEREGIWRTAGRLRLRVVIGGLPDPWPRQLFMTCGRTARKGQPCNALVADGRVSCAKHRQIGDDLYFDAWCEAVHYPMDRWEREPEGREADELKQFLAPYFVWVPIPGWKPFGSQGVGLDEIVSGLATMEQELSL